MVQKTILNVLQYIKLNSITDVKNNRYFNKKILQGKHINYVKIEQYYEIYRL